METDTSFSQLLARFRAGDQDAFGEIWLRHEHRISALIASRTQRNQDRPNLVGSVARRALKWLSHQPVEPTEEEFARWLNQVAANRVREDLRRPAQRRETESLDNSAGGGFAISARTASSLAAAAELQWVVQQIVTDMHQAQPERQLPELLRMRSERMSWEDIAASLGDTTPDGWRKRYERALAAIREQLGVG